jgi:LacI family transcriptional regulator
MATLGLGPPDSVNRSTVTCEMILILDDEGAVPMSEDQVDSRFRKRPSISDVALEAGVSRAAVSKVIRNAYGVSPAMRKRVETAIDRLGYRPRVAARAMRGASFTIGFEIPHIGNDFFTQIMEGATTGLAASRYQLIIAPGLGYLNETTVLEALVDRQVDGVIAISSDVTADWLGQLAKHVPVVVLGRHDHSGEWDTITDDDAAGVDLVMDHLLGLGHQRIAHLTLRPSTDLGAHAVRLMAYRSRMEQAGYEPQVVYLHTSEQSAFDAARKLLKGNNPPTAIFAGHDTLAIGVLRAIAELGLDAEDVSVVGYDNINLAGHPLISLTTVDQFGFEVGVTAIDLLMERIRNGRRSPRHHQLDPQLRIRNSSRPVRSG